MDNDREYDAYDQAEDDALARLRDSNAMSEEDTDKEEEETSPQRHKRDRMYKNTHNHTQTK